MAYRIRYGPPQNGVRRRISLDKRCVTLLLVAAILIVMIVFGSNPTVKAHLIPGDPEITEAAFAGFVLDVRGGISFGDALTAFCKEIIDGAAIRG